MKDTHFSWFFIENLRFTKILVFVMVYETKNKFVPPKILRGTELFFSRTGYAKKKFRTVSTPQIDGSIFQCFPNNCLARFRVAGTSVLHLGI